VPGTESRWDSHPVLPKQNKKGNLKRFITLVVPVLINGYVTQAFKTKDKRIMKSSEMPFLRPAT
jgi:hypothetical protein